MAGIHLIELIFIFKNFHSANFYIFSARYCQIFLHLNLFLSFFQKDFVLAKGRHKWKYKLYTFFVLDQDIIALVTSIVACPVYELCML